MTGPFDPTNHAAYQSWRADKLAGYPARVEDLVVPIGDPTRLKGDEIASITKLCGKANMAVYAGPPDGTAAKQVPTTLGARLGLTQIDASLTTEADGISELTVSADPDQRKYIPYTDRPLGWHTDGCYNPPARLVRGLLLHCVRTAAEGGEDFLLDPEIAYIRLRDENPDFTSALMGPEVLTIPANREDGTLLRDEQTGPVFSVDGEGRKLHMRYTARKRFVRWAADVTTNQALAFLDALLAGDEPYVFRVRLQPGWGLVCNNVLHGRTGFRDGHDPLQKRLYYRIYYNDRIG